MRRFSFFIALCIVLLIALPAFAQLGELHLTDGLGLGSEGPATSLYDSLISFWNLDEASGVRYDAHFTNHLTDNNTVGQAAGVSAETGFAAQFVAANSERLTHGGNADLAVGDIDFTLTYWFYFDSLVGHVNCISRMTASEWVYRIWWNNINKELRFLVADGEVTATSPGALLLSQWYFVACWHDSVLDNINIQVNNGAVDSVSHTTGTLTSTGELSLGGAAGFWFLNGRMDAVGFWKRTLTAEELTYLYNEGQGRQYPF